MKRIIPLLVIVLLVAIFGCNAQRKPATDDPTGRLVPGESNIGFSLMELDQAPAPVKRVASAMSDREMMAWVESGNNNYIIINPVEEDEKVKISEVIQRVPSEDFLWLDVKIIEEDLTDEKQKPELMVVKLDSTAKAINGVGFELRDGDDENKEEGKEEDKAGATTPGPAAKTPVERQPAQPAPETRQVEPERERETAPEQTQPEQPGDRTNGDENENGNGQ